MSLKQQEHARDYGVYVFETISRRMQYNNRLSLPVGSYIVYLSRGPADLLTLSTHDARLWQGSLDELCAMLDSDTDWRGIKARDVLHEVLRIH
jgi:hypothetical protein